MSAAFTPGPWRVGGKYHFEIYANRAGHAIARTVNPQHEGECEANAQLIAAAPDLLAAVQKIIAWDDAENDAPNYESDNGVHWRMRQALCREAFDLAISAIAKATGGAA